MKATNEYGQLKNIPNCYIEIPDLKPPYIENGTVVFPTEGIRIPMNILPDISDKKSANYADESGIGRSMPFKSFQSSENRSISWTVHWIATTQIEAIQIKSWLRALEACTYPRMGSNITPYAPPPICKLKCLSLLGGDSTGMAINAVLRDYSIKFDPTVPWDEIVGIPIKLDLDLQFDVIYNLNSLPGAEMILSSGY